VNQGSDDISKFTEKERLEYEKSMKYLNAYLASLDYAKEEGESIGSLRQAQAMARRMLAKGEALDKIEEYTGLSEPEILSLEDGS
jgi:hypothetical protein